ncbi:hypothetical protein [Soonwooa sp.]|uniref:hypothetical protein n=1 Tax=Soonwooa sp. TaxID=1938592 RepID=UPI0028ACF829|nr:hypothetical protein [Soonwooa sp.]
MNDKSIVFFSLCRMSVNEGGMARNFAVYQEFKDRDALVYNTESTSILNRMMMFFSWWWKLLNFENKKIVITQVCFINIFFPISFFKYHFLANIFKKLLINVANRNSLYIEVNDLIYEQAIDLNIQVSSYAKRFQNMLFSLKGVHFIFASHKMSEFVIENYNCSKENTQVIVNGAPVFEEKENVPAYITIPKDNINFIYAGTLSKGRQIEDMISIFKKTPYNLFLMGIEGDWIKDMELKNVFYLGAFPEPIALKITSMCDYGLIPYDESKHYFNLCYPTKVSFYLSAGLPLFSTPLKETILALKEYGELGIFVPLANWDIFLQSNIDIEKKALLKMNVNSVRDKFTWKYILSHLKLE